MTEPEWTDFERLNGWADDWRQRQAAKAEKTFHLSDETIEKLAAAIASAMNKPVTVVNVGDAPLTPETAAAIKALVKDFGVQYR